MSDPAGNRRKIFGILQVLLAGFGFGFLGIFAKYAIKNNLTTGLLLSGRFLSAGLVLFLGLLLFNRKLLLTHRKQFVTSLLLGLFGYAIFSSLYFKSLEGISVALAAMLLFMFPFFVSLGAHFFLQIRMSPKQWLNLAFAFLGITLLVWGDLYVESIPSLVYGLLAAITYSGYVLLSGVYQKDIHPLTSSLYVIWAAAFGLIVFHQPNLTDFINLNPTQWGLIIAIAVFSTIMPISLFLSGLQKLTSPQASLIVMVEPVVALVAAWVLLSEKMSFVQIIGAIIVILALIFNSLEKRASKLNKNDSQS